MTEISAATMGSVSRETADAMRRGRLAGALRAELALQDEKWGEQNHPDGTGPTSEPLERVIARGGNAWAAALADESKRQNDRRVSEVAEGGEPLTWREILLEEVLEAFAEDNPETLQAELVQVAAVAMQWHGAISRRTEAQS